MQNTNMNRELNEMELEDFSGGCYPGHQHPHHESRRPRQKRIRRWIQVGPFRFPVWVWVLVW